MAAFPARNEQLYITTWNSVQAQDAARRRGLREMLEGPTSVIRLICADLEERRVREGDRRLSRRGGEGLYYNPQGRRVPINELFGEGPDRCYPMSSRSFRDYHRILEQGEDLVPQLLTLRMTVEEALRELGEGKKRRRTAIDAYVPDVNT